MYLDVLQPGDTFPMMMRKMVIAIVAIVGIVPMWIVIQTVLGLLETNSSSYPRFITYVVTMIGSWIYVKWTHTAPTWLIAFWINSCSVLCLLYNLATPNSAQGIVQLALILAVPLCRMHSVNLTVPVTAYLIFLLQ